MADDPKTTEPGQAGGVDLNNPDIQKAIESRIAQEVAGLKSKNSELLGKLSKAQESLQAWDGLDPEAVRSIVKQFEGDEEAKLIKEGKINEVIERRTKAVLERHSKKLEATEAERQAAAKAAESYKSRFQRAVIDNAVARKVTGLQDGALPHVQRMVADWYHVDDNGNIVPTETAPLDAKGDPLKFEELKGHLVEAAPFYFPPSQGGGVTGGAKGNGGAKSISRQQFDALGPMDRQKFVRSGGQVHD